jgi:hypothetical protein
MTLQARVELAIAAECGGIDDGPPRSIEIVTPDGVNVRLPGTMTPLAVDAVGQRTESWTFPIIFDW